MGLCMREQGPGHRNPRSAWFSCLHFRSWHLHHNFLNCSFSFHIEAAALCQGFTIRILGLPSLQALKRKLVFGFGRFARMKVQPHSGWLGNAVRSLALARGWQMRRTFRPGVPSSTAAWPLVELRGVDRKELKFARTELLNISYRS
jgi:hypothetical protein